MRLAIATVYKVNVFQKHLVDGVTYYLLPLHVREFRDVEIGEIRVPVKYREALKAASKIQWGNDQYEIDELFDDQYGSLCCAHKNGAMVRSENIVLSLLREIAYEISV